MASYSYKDVVYQIPQHIEERFKEETGREPDGDPNYDGDYWSLTALWIEELQEKLEYLSAIEEAIDGMDLWDKVNYYLEEENNGD